MANKNNVVTNVKVNTGTVKVGNIKATDENVRLRNSIIKRVNRFIKGKGMK